MNNEEIKEKENTAQTANETANAENDLWKHIEEMKKSNIQEILKLKKKLMFIQIF